ncbi:MAG: transposase [Cellvibrionales bacterium]|nr:transposase [Cellvibrionales bacterium]
MSKQQTIDIDQAELDALIKRLEEARDYDLTLSFRDCQLIIDVLLTFGNLHEQLADNDITLKKLRKLAGIVKSSEKLKDVISGKAKQAKKTIKQSSRKSNKPKAPPIKPEIVHHKLEAVKKGDTCPDCLKGKLYKYEPASFVRIRGQSPLQPEKHVMERLRCNACGQFFIADLPESVTRDGEPSQKYGHSARSLMAISKFHTGVPYYRQGSVQDLLGVPLTASTVFDQVEHVANVIHPVFNTFKKQAANAHQYYIDETSKRILDQTFIEKKARNSDKMIKRTGVYASGLIAIDKQGNVITLFQTNIGHAGEFIDEILADRSDTADAPSVMSDALSRNKPTELKDFNYSLCNAHGRREFVSVIDHFPDEVTHILEWYQKIWSLDQRIKRQNLSDEKRLELHKRYSMLIMQQLYDDFVQCLEEELVEQNSGLGKAMQYFINHFEGLTQFCKVKGAPIDNNLMEQALKWMVRDRKNAMFHKTISGAAIADVITSIIATAANACVNVFEYLNTLQRYAKEVKDCPEKFMPWNYEEALITLSR